MQGLIELLRSFGSVAIGFSGGVDSTFLAAVSIRALPPADVHLIHLDTPFVGTPERESFERERERFERAGAHVVALETDPLADPDVAANPADRCYHCKRLGCQRIVDAARELGVRVVLEGSNADDAGDYRPGTRANPADRCYHCKRLGCQRIVDAARELGVRVVLEGSNADDAGDYRPGTRAVRELDVRSPLMETGWCKDEERALLRAWGFEVWDLPAGACLATRIPCGETLTAEKLHTVRMCEDYLHGLGLRQVRVRIDDGVARVSVGATRIPCGETLTAEKLHTVRMCEDYLHGLGLRQVRVRIDDGVARVSVGNDELESLLFDTAAEDAPSLPLDVVRELERQGDLKVDPIVRAYIHGEGNGRN